MPEMLLFQPAQVVKNKNRETEDLKCQTPTNQMKIWLVKVKSLLTGPDGSMGEVKFK